MKHINCPEITMIAMANGMKYMPGTRVQVTSLVSYDNSLKPGDRGTVRFVDTRGVVYVKWDCGVYQPAFFGVDRIEKI